MTDRDLELIDEITNEAMDLVRDWYPREDVDSEGCQLDSQQDDDQYTEMHNAMRTALARLKLVKEDGDGEEED